MFYNLCREERMSILSVDQLKRPSPISMVDGTFGYVKADYNLLFFNDMKVRSFQNPIPVVRCKCTK